MGGNTASSGTSVAPPMSLSAQLMLVDASASRRSFALFLVLFLSLNCLHQSPPAYATIGVVANIPVTNTAANAAMVNILLFMVHMPIKLDYI